MSTDAENHGKDDSENDIPCISNEHEHRKLAIESNLLDVLPVSNDGSIGKHPHCQEAHVCKDDKGDGHAGDDTILSDDNDAISKDDDEHENLPDIGEDQSAGGLAVFHHLFTFFLSLGPSTEP
mmetsp:Transcript_16725/g.38617  ORF Transcript_16725/g.38617 Transcript_16725/m.38617 type:complete len:123 (-) Transcript_16725:501-869(-)